MTMTSKPEPKVNAVVDCETTGLSENLNEIASISVAIYEDTKVVNRFHSLVRPYRVSNISPVALDRNKLRLEDLMKAPNQMEVKGQFLEWWSNEVGELIKPFGYNYSGFDYLFIRNWLGDEVYKSVFHYRAVNVDSVLRFMVQFFPEKFPELVGESLSLENVTAVLGLFHKPHDSNSDALVLIELMEFIKDRV